MNTLLIPMCVVLMVLLIAFTLSVYLRRSSYFKKGLWGKKSVDSSLKRFASRRGMTVLSDVTVSDGSESARFDHVLIGYFGVLFVQSIQGAGSFWGDGEEDTWAFTDGDSKLLFKNPLSEMEEKVAVFRRVLSKNKIYRVPVESTVVIVTLAETPKMYLSNIEDPSTLLTQKGFASFLQQEQFEQDNGVDPKAIAALFTK